jgi:hypothetical protein
MFFILLKSELRYLVKVAVRVLAGLKFVELLILYGAKRSGKDTFVNVLQDMLDVRHIPNAVGWMSTAPAHYFTAPTFQRFEPESHAAVTHEFNQLRLMLIAEVPRQPLLIKKERLEGVSHARAGHSRAGEVQEVALDGLWLMHGNFHPRLEDPNDVAQVDRVNPVHFKLEFGNPDNIEHIWDNEVPTTNRRREDPSVKQRAQNGEFAAELFTHCANARKCLRSGERKIEPRPASVIQAARELMINVGGRDLKALVCRFCDQFTEPREYAVESWAEIRFGMKIWIERQGFILAGQSLGSYLGDRTSSTMHRAPRGHPSTFPIWPGTLAINWS